eukprot:133114_1
MEENVFKQTESCKHDSVLDCVAVQRIKYILYKLNSENNENIIDIMQQISQKYSYTNIKLMNDFHHIKHHHGLVEDDLKFSNLFAHFTDSNDKFCDVNKCKYVTVYYRDRSKFSNDSEISHNHTVDLIARIHVYFI